MPPAAAPLTTPRLFLRMTAAALGAGVAIAMAAQALAGSIAAGFGLVAASASDAPVNPAGAAVGVAFLAFVGAVAGGIVVGASWLSCMGVYLLYSRDHRIHSAEVPWIAVLQAALAAGLGYVVFGWIADRYVAASSR